MSKQLIHLRVVTPEETLLETKVTEVSVPTIDGEITLLPGHINLITELAEGELRYRVPGSQEDEYLLIFGGVLSLHRDQLMIVAKSAVRAQDIDVARAEAAKKEAEEMLSKKLENVQFAQVKASLRRVMMELELAKKYRKIKH